MLEQPTNSWLANTSNISRFDGLILIAFMMFWVCLGLYKLMVAENFSLCIHHLDEWMVLWIIGFN